MYWFKILFFSTTMDALYLFRNDALIIAGTIHGRDYYEISNIDTDTNIKPGEVYKIVENVSFKQLGDILQTTIGCVCLTLTKKQNCPTALLNIFTNNTVRKLSSLAI